MNFRNLSPQVELTLSADLIRRVGRGIRIERLPSALAIGCTSFANIHSRAIHDGLQTNGVRVEHARAHNRAASTDALGINLGIFFADSSLRKCAQYAACHTPSCGARQSGDQPSGSHYRANSWDSHEAKPGEQACNAAHSSAHPCARPRRL